MQNETSRYWGYFGKRFGGEKMSKNVLSRKHFHLNPIVSNVKETDFFACKSGGKLSRFLLGVCID